VVTPEITIESKDGQVKKIPGSIIKHILVRDGDFFVKAGMPLSDGSISPADLPGHQKARPLCRNTW